MFNSFCVQIIANIADEHSISVIILIKDLYEQHSSNFIAILGTVAQMERDNIKFRLDSGRELYKRSGGKLGRKTGYRKSKEQKLEQYAGVIKLLKKGYPVRNIAKIEGVGISTVMRFFYRL